ncbi:MAG: nucleotidyltransferase family protein, partial [Clostridia bacterium]|nr:nucleotidyltransferase family protein [Clostridia bacterium]
FALGGVSLLRNIGCDAISFGAEDADLPRLRAAARLLEAPDAAFTAALRRHLDAGLGHPAAVSAAAEEAAPGLGGLLSAPNNTLAVCYLRAMLRLGADMEVCPIPRIGSYHATSLDAPLPSATALRGAILRGDWSSAIAAVPEAARPILMEAAQEGRIHRPNALDLPLLYRLRTAGCAGLPGLSEGVDDRLTAAAAVCCDRESLLDAAKTRRYPRARLARLCAHALLDVTPSDLDASPLPPAALLLGFRQDAAPLLRRLSAGSIPLLARAADYPRGDAWFRIERRAWDLWALGCGLPSDMIFTQKMVRV